ncbi:MAG: hypothetical protein ACI310_00200 [Bacilli bacterium]
MKQIKYILFSFLILFLSIISVNADCTNEELLAEKEKAENIRITYNHLGEVTKDDGSKVYNEFLVTTKNIPEGIYVHLSPMTEENFDESMDDLKIKLTTGTWYYNMYSSKCETVVDTITVKLPRFNIYSLDPLCEGIDSDDFQLCSKYYEYEFSRETFERKVKTYRLENNIGKIDNNVKEKNNNILKTILNFIETYNLFIVGFLIIILIILIVVIIISKKKKRTVLE